MVIYHGYSQPALNDPWPDAHERHDNWRSGGTPDWRTRMEELWTQVDQDTRDVEYDKQRADAQLKLRITKLLSEQCPCRSLPQPPDPVDPNPHAVDGRNRGTGNGAAVSGRTPPPPPHYRRPTCPFAKQCPHHVDLFPPIGNDRVNVTSFYDNEQDFVYTGSMRRSASAQPPHRKVGYWPTDADL